MICRPTGRPSASPQGTEIAGRPARLAGRVHRSAAYMASGSSTRAPSGKAAVGLVGLTRTSTPSSAGLKDGGAVGRGADDSADQRADLLRLAVVGLVVAAGQRVGAHTHSALVIRSE